MRRIVTALLASAVITSGCSSVRDVSAPEPIAPLLPGPALSAPEKPVPATDSFTVVAAGDELIHPAVTDQALADGNGKRDYSAILAGVKPVIEQADLAICHLETPIAKPGGPFLGYPKFSVPPEIATALAGIGYDTCSTASNHTLDQGPAGVATTVDTLDAAGIKHTGSARSASEAATPLILDVHGIKVAQISFTFGFNQGTSAPKSQPWLGNV